MVHAAFYFATTPEEQWADGDVNLTVPRSLRPALFRAARDKADEIVTDAAKLEIEASREPKSVGPASLFARFIDSPEEVQQKRDALFALYREAMATGDCLIGHPARKPEEYRPGFIERVASEQNRILRARQARTAFCEYGSAKAAYDAGDRAAGDLINDHREIIRKTLL